jgi:biofilm protein TabA
VGARRNLFLWGRGVSILASVGAPPESRRMALFGSISTVRAQLANADRFQATFAYLDECFRPGTEAFKRVRAIEVGKQERTELAGGAFGLEQVYMSKQRPDAFFESHKQYIDVQVIVEGEEFIEVADIAKLKVQEDKTPAKDVIIYHMADAGSATSLRLGAGDASILFPVDGHMPTVAIKESALVRKIVVKVPVA